MTDGFLQIDVMEKLPDLGMMRCNMYTPGRCVTIYMSEYDYKELTRDGFFIRSGDESERDSAGVLNTSKAWREETVTP